MIFVNLFWHEIVRYVDFTSFNYQDCFNWGEYDLTWFVNYFIDSIIRLREKEEEFSPEEMLERISYIANTTPFRVDEIASSIVNLKSRGLSVKTFLSERSK